MRLLQALLLLFAVAIANPANAQASKGKARELTIGLSATVTSMDPHYHNLTPNNSLLRHVFDTLVRQDSNQTLIPGLARRWQALDDKTWEFTLRDGVRWHDGSPFTADDVVFTLKRAADVPNSPASFTAFVRQITAVEVKNVHTLRIKTAVPVPLLPNDMSSVMIVSRKHGERATTDDYNSGKAAIGTGPYKFVEYTPNQRVVLGANFGYWAGEEPWEKVTFKMLTNPASRVAALLSGDVDMIEGVPTADITDLRRNNKVRLANRVSNRVIYLHLDSGRKEKSPFTFDKQGAPLVKNPLADSRVRQAISKAIDRNAIVSKIMEGNALAAGQLLADGFFGVSKNLKAEKPDPEGARRLLAQAGYPDGFALTLHSPNNRYINDANVAQAVAQMLTRVGIQTKVEAMPSSVFFTRASKLEFSLILAGWGAESGETSSPLKALLATYDKDKGMGSANRGRYSNPALDKTLEQALSTIDDIKRAALLAQATELGIRDAGIVPLHYEISTWAMKAGLRFVPRADQYTFAMDLRS